MSPRARLPIAVQVAAALLAGTSLASPTNAAVHTWWHPNEELNESTPVAPQNVRRSTFYNVYVEAVETPGVLNDSFVYMSLPRSGRDKEGYTSDDGAEFSAAAGMTMSWSSFLYDDDAWVYVRLEQGQPLESIDEVTIRPTKFAFEKELVDERTVRILVPYAAEGYRFSVEFSSELMTSYVDASNVLTTEAAGNRAVHTEPRNGMLIFAEPMPTGRAVDFLTPNPDSWSIYYPEEGNIPNLDDVTEEVVYFRPGTYYMDANYHARLPANVRWLYLAPGAHVKGAFQFQAPLAEPTVVTDLRVTGFGVLSGEVYVYEADRANGYLHRSDSTADCHASCVKLLEFSGGAGHEHLSVHGVTLADAPYHAFVIYGEETIWVTASHGKQVGGWYWQTDGIESYGNSSLRDMFFHVNDDVLKLYASNAEISDIVVWKLENGPVIQWGWVPRNIERVHVNRVDIIHNRMHWDAHNSCLINSARHYGDPSSTQLADPNALVSDILITNVRSEGMNHCAMRLFALSSWENIQISNLWIEQWNELDTTQQASRLEALSNESGERVSIGDEVTDGEGLLIEGYAVGDEQITKEADNWQANRLGRLDFDPTLWTNWNAVYGP